MACQSTHMEGDAIGRMARTGSQTLSSGSLAQRIGQVFSSAWHQLATDTKLATWRWHEPALLTFLRERNGAGVDGEVLHLGAGDRERRERDGEEGCAHHVEARWRRISYVVESIKKQQQFGYVVEWMKKRSNSCRYCRRKY